MNWNEHFHLFVLAFVPLFFAMDAVGVVPVFLSMTSHVSAVHRSNIINTATLTALVVSVVFVITGKFLFKMMGITADDFRIGGGIVLLLTALSDLISQGEEKRRIPGHELAIVPIGMPLIVGPSALTTLIMLVDRYSYLITLVALLLNLAIVWLVFSNSKWIVRVMGKGGTLAFGKVASLFLVAIAVMLIRVGIINSFGIPLPHAP